MRVTRCDSSDDEETGEEQLTPLQVSWLPLSAIDCSHFLGICALPGCKYGEIRRNLQKDVETLHNQGVQDVFVFCTTAELNFFRVSALIQVYQEKGLTVHHMPFQVGSAPEMLQCYEILEELQLSLENGRRTLIHCFKGMGRSGLIAACLLLQLSSSMTPNEAMDIIREYRGSGAIETLKQYNFLQEFREKFSSFQQSREFFFERRMSR